MLERERVPGSVVLAGSWGSDLTTNSTDGQVTCDGCCFKLTKLSLHVVGSGPLSEDQG